MSKNFRCFGSRKTPWNNVGRPSCVTQPMLDALCEHWLEKPGLFEDLWQDECLVDV
jgi:hypothetical protein